MSVPRTVGEVIAQHVTLELECLDRVYLNVYQPLLQTPRGVYHFLREHHGVGAVSSRKMKAISERFIGETEAYARKHGAEILTLEKGQRKENIAAERLRDFTQWEGVLFIGKAQEKVRTFRTEGCRNAQGQTYPWIVKSTAMMNHSSFYAVDEEFGLFFLKYSSYFPYGAKLCFNGHEWLKRQLRKEGIAFEELAKGILSCANPARLQVLANRLTPQRIEKFCGNGSVCCRARFVAAKNRPAIATTSRCARWSSHSRKCSTGRSRAGYSSRRSCSRTSTWVVPTTCH